MMTTWVGGVEAAAAVAPATEGEAPAGQEEEWVVSERDPPEEERQTSGNHLKVTSCFSLWRCSLIGRFCDCCVCLVSRGTSAAASSAAEASNRL